eukprot:COSAG03_NODE_1919_length_3353_cov_32.836816_2_plen_61_part_00
MAQAVAPLCPGGAVMVSNPLKPYLRFCHNRIRTVIVHQSVLEQQHTPLLEYFRAERVSLE